MAYRINFENYKEATAPAQVVVIENPVPANLDINTLEFTSAGFGDQLFVIPAGTQHYEHTAKMTFNGATFDVLIEVRLDRENRTVLARFESIEPLSGLPPTVNVGFLPPEDGSGRGKGHIAYVVKPAAAVATGTEIRNIGFITFDPLAGGATYRTDLSVLTDPNSPPDENRQALVTIDNDPPTGAVLALPAASSTASFLVSWAGSDAGSGIVSYDIYARTNGGPWTVWLDDVSTTSATWTGKDSHSYGFIAVARDETGLSEAPPNSGTAPEAQTNVKVEIGAFKAFAGAYHGLIVSEPASRAGSGVVKLTLNAKGALTLSATLNGRKLKGRGVLAENGTASIAIKKTAVVLALEFDPVNAQFQAVVRDGQNILGELTAERPAYHAKNNSVPVPMRGAHTAILTTSSQTEPTPGRGSGFGSVKVTAGGTVRFAGVLGNGTKVSYSAPLLADDTLPLYLESKKANDIALGYVTFRHRTGESDFDGELDWFGTPDADGSPAFAATVQLTGSRYNRASILPSLPAPNTNGNVDLTFSGGNLANDLSQSINLASAGEATAVEPALPKFRLKINAGTGLFQGSFGSEKSDRQTFYGAFLQEAELGAGLFRSSSGEVGELELRVSSP